MIPFPFRRFRLQPTQKKPLPGSEEAGYDLLFELAPQAWSQTSLASSSVIGFSRRMTAKSMQFPARFMMTRRLPFESSLRGTVHTRKNTHRNSWLIQA